MVTPRARPLFPLTPADLERWTRFGLKGGIGQARAKADKASHDGGQKDLMFLEGEVIVILLDLGQESYLGYCEGVVGMLYGADVEMLQAKLKRPVTTARPRRANTTDAPAPAETAARTPLPQSPPLPDRSTPAAKANLVLNTQADPTRLPTARRRSLSPSSSLRWVTSPTSSTTAISSTAGTPSQGSHPSPLFEHANQLAGSASSESESPFLAPTPQLGQADWTGPITPTGEVFPLSELPIPASGGAHFGDLEMAEEAGVVDAPALETSTSSKASSKLFAFPPHLPSHVLSASTGMPVPPPPLHPISAFSFSPNSSFASTMPSSVFSAGDLELHREGGKTSDLTIRSGTSSSAGTGPGSQWSGTNTPGDDPTLAFIFDSYQHSSAEERSRAGSQVSASQQQQQDPPGVDTLAQSGRPRSGLVRSASTESVLRYAPKPTAPAYGTASALRSRLLAGDHLEPVKVPIQRLRGDSTVSSTSSLAPLRLLRSSLDSLDNSPAPSSLFVGERGEIATSSSSSPRAATISTAASTCESPLLDAAVGQGVPAEAVDHSTGPKLGGRARGRPYEISTAPAWTSRPGHAPHPYTADEAQYITLPTQASRRPLGRTLPQSATTPEKAASPRSTARFTASPTTAESPDRGKLSKLRRPTRTKSSPSLRPKAPNSPSSPRAEGLTHSIGSGDPFLVSPSYLPSPVRSQTGPIRSATLDSTDDPTSPRKRTSVDYTTGISNRDFEEETIQIGKSEFEIVKPLATMLLNDSEPISSPSLDESRPSVSTAESEPFTPSRPRAATLAASSMPTSPTTPSTPYKLGSSLTRSTTSMSHFSPPTPGSVEGNGKGTLDEYRAREAKWIAALSSMSPAQIRKSKKMRGLVQSGIPSSVRGKVWAYLAETERFVQPGLFQCLCGDPVALPAMIEHDLLGINDDSQFAVGTAGRSDLEAVLLAFLRSQSQLGYYPGLAQVACTLLTQMPAESAFATLVALVCGYGYHIFFPSRRYDLDVQISMFSFLLESLESKLARRLRDFRVSPNDYLPVWLSTLYSSILPQSTVLRLLDIFFYDPRMLYRIPIALLSLSNLGDRELFPSRDAVLNHLLAPPPEAFDPALVVPAAFSVKVTDDKIAKARKKAEQAVRTGTGAT
ncbi:hypothetical protein JCM10908_007182 [Rhodotorula pacifica]|uniref:uncharacterized protein n=1 Tax=Rhodotorula pacifica TaxID=1495444 RepID=UPI00318099B6